MNTSVRLNIALAILTMGCFAVIFFSGRQIEKRDVEIDRLIRNQHELMAANEQQTTLILKQKELSGKYLSERDSLAKLLKIRPKEVIKYIDRVLIEKITDTVEVESLIINEIGQKNGKFYMIDSDGDTLSAYIKVADRVDAYTILPRIYSGVGAPSIAAGKAGDIYINTSNGTIYISSAAGSGNWRQVSN